MSKTITMQTEFDTVRVRKEYIHCLEECESIFNSSPDSKLEYITYANGDRSVCVINSEGKLLLKYYMQSNEHRN